MKKKGSMKEKDKVAKKTAMQVLSMPFCAHCVQISTTRLLSATLAAAAVSRLMWALMNSTAREAPAGTAWEYPPVDQNITAPPELRPTTKRPRRSQRFSP